LRARQRVDTRVKWGEYVFAGRCTMRPCAEWFEEIGVAAAAVFWRAGVAWRAAG